MTDQFIWNYGGPKERITSVEETKQLLQEIHDEIVRNKHLIYKHDVSIRQRGHCDIHLFAN